jgi:hypothetical protein
VASLDHGKSQLQADRLKQVQLWLPTLPGVPVGSSPVNILFLLSLLFKEIVFYGCYNSTFR